MSSPSKILRSHFELNRSDRVFWFDPTEVGDLCVTVRFCVEAIYTPPPILHSWREPSERAYTSTTHFLRENHLLMCWDQDIPIQTQESWSLALPKLLSSQIIFPSNPNLWERVECWGDYHLKHKSKEFIINTPFLPLGEWCLLDWLGVTWEPPSRLWSWTKEFVRVRRSPTSWRSTLVRQVLRGRWPWWDR